MSVDWKKNATASLFKVHVNGYVCFLTPSLPRTWLPCSMSPAEMQALEMITCLRLHLNMLVCMRALSLLVTEMSISASQEIKPFWKKQLTYIMYNKAILEKIIIGNFWVMMAIHFVFQKQSEWQCGYFEWLLIIMKLKSGKKYHCLPFKHRHKHWDN